MTFLDAVGLGALQGVTEFLPISSSGHLVLAEQLLGVKESPLPFIILLHLGSLAAILLYFWSEVWSVVTTRRHLIPPLVAGTLPALVVYLSLEARLEVLFKTPVGVGFGLLLTGTVLWVGERMATETRSLTDLRMGDGFWIGMAQAIALVPGISRSGMTVAGGLASGLERAAAVAFAFLLGAVAIAGATVIKAKALVGLSETMGWAPLVGGFVASAVVSLASLALLTVVVRRKCLFGFGIYCYVLGSGILLAKLAGLW